MQHFIADVRTDGGFGHDVNFAAKQVFQVLLDGHEIEQMSAWLEVNEKFDVTAWSRGAARQRA